MSNKELIQETTQKIKEKKAAEKAAAAATEENIPAVEATEESVNALIAEAPGGLMTTSAGEGYELKKVDGKFKRVAVYKPWSSVKPETRAQKIALMNLLNGQGANPLNNYIGAQIVIADVIFNPYDSIDEDTGELTNGVLTYLITPDNVAYVTSSKSVYFTLKNAFKVVGEPHWNEDEALTVQVKKQKSPTSKFEFTDLEIIG